jgi:hypothetical protein
VAAALAAAGAVLTGCGHLPSLEGLAPGEAKGPYAAPESGPSGPPASESAILEPEAPEPSTRGPAPGPAAEPLDVFGAVPTAEDGLVSTECFTFDLPPGYVVKENGSIGCTATLNWEEGDSLTRITVGGSADPADRQGWADLLHDGTWGIIEDMRDRKVAGFDGFEALITDQYGLRIKVWVGFIPDDLYAEDGKAITAIAVFGYWSEMVDGVYQMILDSIELKAPPRDGLIAPKSAQPKTGGPHPGQWLGQPFSAVQVYT